jgi:hypothetical protein
VGGVVIVSVETILSVIEVESRVFETRVSSKVSEELDIVVENVEFSNLPKFSLVMFVGVDKDSALHATGTDDCAGVLAVVGLLDNC